MKSKMSGNLLYREDLSEVQKQHQKKSGSFMFEVEGKMLNDYDGRIDIVNSRNSIALINKRFRNVLRLFKFDILKLAYS